MKNSSKWLGHEFVITRELDAPREMVWNAWTDAKQLALWWGPRGFTTPTCDWDARAGKKIYAVMRGPGGQEYPMGGEFIEIDPPKRLVFTSGALDADGVMMFAFRHVLTLVGRGGKTKLTLKSKVISTTDEAANNIGGFDAGMTQSLDKLATLVTENEPLVVERTFDAPVERVWKALTTKEAIKEWSFEMKEFKAEPGFEFEFHGEKDGVKFLHQCKIAKVIPNKKLAYSWRYEGHEGDSLVTWELFSEGDKTRVRLTHEGLHTFPKTGDFARTNFFQGWTYIVGTSLQKYVEDHSSQQNRRMKRE